MPSHRAPTHPAARELAAVIGAQLRDLISATGTNQSELARKLGITRSAVSYFVSGRYLPNISTLCRFADALGYRVELRAIPNPPSKGGDT